VAVAVSSIRQAKLTLHVIQAVDRPLALAHALDRGRSEIEVLEILEILEAVGHQLAQVVGLRATGGGGQLGEALLNGGVEADGGSRDRSLYSL